MTTVRRIAAFLVDGALFRTELVEELKQDPAVADDGLIAITVIGTLITGLTTFDWLPTVLAPVVFPLLALFMAFVLRLVSRVAGIQATLAETTATVTLTGLPLLLIPIPLVGGPAGLLWWVLAGILMLRRITLARLDNAAVVTLLSHAASISAVFGAGFAVDALL